MQGIHVFCPEYTFSIPQPLEFQFTKQTGYFLLEIGELWYRGYSCPVFTIVLIYSTLESDKLLKELVCRFRFHPLPMDYFTAILDARESHLNETESMAIIRPYHALLLLTDPEEIMSSLPPDSCPILVMLLLVTTPTLSLLETSALLSVDLSIVYKLICHLCYHKKAKLIKQISQNNVYVLGECRNLPLFQARFPQMDLDLILSQMSIPGPFSCVIPDKKLKNLYLDVLAWLIRHDYAVQLDMYLSLIIPNHIVKKVAESISIEGAADGKEGNKDPEGLPSSRIIKEDRVESEAYIVDIKNMTRFDRMCIDEIAAGQPGVEHLFRRLVPYLTGTFSVEEILYSESWSRRDLKLVLGSFRNLIISTLHTDPTI